MAEGKNKIIVYADWKSTFDKLTDEEAGRLIKHFFAYVNDDDPEPVDRLTEIVFEPIKQTLKRDLKAWEEKTNGFSNAGKESAKSRNLMRSQVYVLRFYNDDEEFVKVGVTDLSIGRRYSSAGNGGGKLGYKFEIEFQHFPENGTVSLCEIEEFIKNQFSKFRYTPEKNFAGHMECYSIDCLNEIKRFLTSFNNVQSGSTNSTVRDTVSVSVTVNDNVSPVLLEKEPKELTKRFDFKSALLSIGVSEKHATDWMDVRRKQKASNTETAFDAVYLEIKKSGIDPDECVRIAAASSWRGLKSEWLKNTINNGNANTRTPVTATDNLANAKRNMAEQLVAALKESTGGESGLSDSNFPGNGENNADTWQTGGD